MVMAAMDMVSTWGFSGVKLSFRKMSAGGRLCTFQENSHFWVRTFKVGPPYGIYAGEFLLQHVKCSIQAPHELPYVVSEFVNWRNKWPIYLSVLRRWLAVTQFQATEARRAFPCFDEPAYKARFSISLARRQGMTAVSNMPVKTTIPV